MSAICQEMSLAVHDHGIETLGEMRFHNRISDIEIGCRKTPSLVTSKNFTSLHRQPELLVVTDSLIRNRPELAAHLSISQEDIARISNAELLAVAYGKWGKDCPKYLRGEFSFVIFDARNQCVIFARDPMGKYPLYYKKSSNAFLFATDIKAICSVSDETPAVNKERIAEIAFGTFRINKGSTFYKDIYSFLPGHIASYADGSMSHSEYWKPNLDRRIDLDHEDTLAEFRHVLSDTVDSFLQTDLNFGVLLSGGLDSSALVSLAARRSKNGLLKTYSSIPPDSTSPRASGDSEFLEYYDEHPNVQVNEVSCEQGGPLSNVDKAVKNWEMPLLASAHYRYQAFGEAALANGHSALLDGVYGELGASYTATPYFRELLLSRRWSTLYREFKAKQSLTDYTVRSLIFSEFFGSYFRQKKTTKPLYELILQSEFLNKYIDADSIGSRNKVFWSVRDEQFERICLSQKTSSRIGALGDCHGVRRVFPYSDIRILEFCLAANSSVKTHNGYSRYLIRGAMDGIVPDKIRFRLTKSPFAPEKRQRYLEQLEWANEYLSSISPSDPVREIVDVSKLLSLSNTSVQEPILYMDEVCLGIYLIVFLRQFDEFSPTS